MGSLSTLNLIKTSVVPQRTTLPSSAKLSLPSQCFTFSTCMNRSNNQSLNKNKSTVIRTRVSTVDSSPQQEYQSTGQGNETENDIENRIEYIRMLLKTTGDGRISVSPYDTAWIALIKDLEGRDSPQFPSSVEWIAENQLPDGSWGDEQFFCVYDRLVNTLACVVALSSWNLHSHKIEKAPHTYPVDIFGRLWAVDRLQRLGISRFFESEISDCLSHVQRFWSDKGVFSGRESVFCDIDDTSMGVRLLRMHGYHVDPNVLENFKQGEKFTCYGGQMIECSSPIYNLYRASQLRFPGEQILEEANNFAYGFLQEKLASNQILDKWVISNHLPDEIQVGLEMPWYATLPRVEASYYLQHYGGADDVWIGKTLYRMPEISNDTYLELARMDFRRCQAQHQLEWIYIQEWYESCRIQEFGISRKEVLGAYFLAAATIFEVERAKERLAWAKSQIISQMIKSVFNNETAPSNHKEALSTQLFGNINALHKSKTEKREDGGVDMVAATLNQFLEEFDIFTRQQLKAAWRIWLRKVQQGEAHGGADAELLTTTLNTCAKQHILSHQPDYNTLSKLTDTICHKLSQIQHQKVQEKKGGRIKAIKNMEVDHDMQCLVKLVLEKSGTGGLNRKAKQTFLSIAKTYYYRAYYADQTMDAHIFKVLFEPVV